MYKLVSLQASINSIIIIIISCQMSLHPQHYQQDSEEETLLEKVELRCTTMISGELCAMMTGTWLMPLLYVVSLALLVPLEPQQIHSLKEVRNYKLLRLKAIITPKHSRNYCANSI